MIEVPKDASTELYAEVSERFGFDHVYPSPGVVRMCSPTGPVVAVTVTLAWVDPENARHWAWWDHERQHFSMIWPTKLQLEMCFPNGLAVSEELGHGRGCHVLVRERKTS